MKLMIFGCFLLLLSGCAHWETHQKAQADKYIGQPIESMYDEYGAPTAIAPMKSGGKFIEFRSFKTGYLCSAQVKTDQKAIIISITTGGQNGCITGRY